MTGNLSFFNEHWLWPVVICAAILLLVFIWKEWSQSGNRRIILKGILIFSAITALSMIALKPAYPGNETAGNYVLVTEGYKPDQLDSLLEDNNKLKVVEYSSKGSLPKELSSAENVFILGHGLPEYDLWQLEEVPAIYLGGNIPEGVVKWNYQQETAVGDRILLEGLYQNAERGKRLVLQGPAGAGLDSVALAAEEMQPFRLTTGLISEGNYVYTLVEKDSLGELLASHPVPVRVNEKSNLKVLIVNSFPIFETKYLKNFLGESGHEVVVRSRITRGRYKYEYFNTERIPVGSLSENTLEPFDLLILDAGSFRNLSSGEVNALENLVRESGLGIFIQPDDNFFNAAGKLAVLNFNRVQGGEVSIPEWPGIRLGTYPYRVRDEFAVQKIREINSSIATGYRRLGQGRIGTTVFTNTYQLLLDGHINEYRQLWSQVVESISKKENPVAEWEQEAMIVYKDEPFEFRLRTSLEDPVVQYNGENIVSLVQDLNFPELWRGTTWPRQTGWNRLHIDTTSALEFYVSEEGNFSSLTAYKTIAENKKFFDQPVSPDEGYKPLEPVNPLWFYGIFVLCIGGLWLEPKM